MDASPMETSTPSNSNSNSNSNIDANSDAAGMPPATLAPMHVLESPVKSIGQGSNQLQYTSGSPAWQCNFSRDGMYLAVCFGAPDPCVRVWKYEPPSTATSASKTKTPAEAKTDDHGSISANGTWTLTSTLEGVHTRTIRSVAFAPVQSPLVLAMASFDATVSIWETDPRRAKADGRDTMEWDCTTQLEGHDNEVKCVVWNSIGSLLATCGRDKSVWIWECFLPGVVGSTASDTGDFECLAVLNGHEADVKSVKFASSHGQWGDGEEICLSSAYDDTIKVWAEDAGDWYCALSIDNVHTDTIWTLAVSPGSGRVVSGSSDGSIAIYKSYTRQEKKELFPEERNGSTGHWHCVGRLPDAHSAEVYTLDCAPSRAGHGRIASGGGDNRIQIYREDMGSTSDEPKFALDTVVSTSHGDVNCVCWHPWDGSVLCSAGDDGKVQLW
eukprot:CAMPEP_0198112590 /NCGR_PEP_ID=MMETSP1442-20131203/4413_1 /TAXON_ID= /ORGANISM="Craspedostauros australis, Strain CCMP3328" /LENGTH=440 /DNA_ID=CAMNT_0043769409 /DNA_START=83 /DNA_END=1402 /DNA_ORIENTATION=+